jgi:hypothetical protein
VLWMERNAPCGGPRRMKFVLRTSTSREDRIRWLLNQAEPTCAPTGIPDRTAWPLNQSHDQGCNGEQRKRANEFIKATRAVDRRHGTMPPPMRSFSATSFCPVSLMLGSYEHHLATLEGIIKRYRAALAGDERRPLSRAQAIQRIKALGFTQGDAERWLEPKPRRPLSAK